MMNRLKLNPKTAGVNLKRERRDFCGFDMIDFQVDKLLRHLLKEISRAFRDSLVGGYLSLGKVEFYFCSRKGYIKTSTFFFQLVVTCCNEGTTRPSNCRILTGVCAPQVQETKAQEDKRKKEEALQRAFEAKIKEVRGEIEDAHFSKPVCRCAAGRP